jgi:outer membrane lipoprotein-sorting protein
MSIVTRHPSLRWLAPVLATAVLASAGTVIAATSSATAGDTLPERSAAQLLVDVQGARLAGLSGTVVQTADLGLPALPGVGGGDSSEFSSLVSGSHTLRVWSAGADKTRVALLGQYGESDLVHNGSDVWAWSSHSNTAKHVTLQAGKDKPETNELQSALTPQQAADKALAAVDPTTTVTTDRTAIVAGRTAYQLVLAPKDPASLVGSVRIAIDSETHVPTRVQVFAVDATDPAFEVGFTSFDPTTPADSVFAFNPPPGATVTEGMLGMAGAEPSPSSGTDSGSGSGTEKPTVVGTGWSTVVVGTLPTQGSDVAGDAAGGSMGSLDALVGQLPRASGAWGSGHVLSGTLFSAVVTDDGRVAAGAVAPAQLYAALGTE